MDLHTEPFLAFYDIFVKVSISDVKRSRSLWSSGTILPLGTPRSWLLLTVVPPRATHAQHAFGNFRDILKEVSFHPIMGLSLSFIDSRSTDSYRRSEGGFVFPDENFAREVMQVRELARSFATISTPSQHLSGYLYLARAAVFYRLVGTESRWHTGAGFARATHSDVRHGRHHGHGEGVDRLRRSTGQGQHRRYEICRVTQLGTHAFIEPGLSSSISAWKTLGNFVDPMELVAERRDRFPKKSIRGGYIGDGLPLCSELPEKHWTRKGATWRLLGNDPKPHMEEQDPKR